MTLFENVVNYFGDTFRSTVLGSSDRYMTVRLIVRTFSPPSTRRIQLYLTNKKTMKPSRYGDEGKCPCLCVFSRRQSIFTEAVYCEESHDLGCDRRSGKTRESDGHEK